MSMTRSSGYSLSESFWRWSVVAIALLGLALRLYAAWDWNSYHPNSPQRLIGDEPGYDNIARELLQGFGFTWPGRVPLYPLWLAGVYWLTGGSFNAVPYAQSLLGVAAILLTYALGRRISGRAVGVIAGFLAAISYILIHQSLHTLSEVLYTPLVLLAAITLLDALRDPTAKRFAWAGFWIGASNLVRPTLLLFPVVSIVLLVALLNKKQAIRHWMVYVLTATLVVTPWVLYTYARHHAIFPLQTSNAILWQGSPEYYHLIHDEGYTYMQVWTEVLYGPNWEAHDPTSVEGDRYWTARALQSIANEPWLYLKYAAEKVVTFWIGDPNADWGDTYVFNYTALGRIGFTRRDAVFLMIARALPIAALLAGVVLWRRRRALLPIYALLAYYTLLHAATHAEARLSEPLQPFLLILIAGAIVQLAGSTVVSMTRSSGYSLDVMTTLVGRELSLRYKGSLLGLLWAILSPLGTVFVMHLLFTRILPLNIPHYAAFVYCGLLPWTWFQAAVQTSSATLIDNRDLVRKPFFPRPLLPAVVTTTNLILYLLALPVLLVILTVEGLPLAPTLALLPLVWLVQAIFTFACAILFAALGVLIRDVQHLLGVVLLLWFYLTPIFYDLDRVAPVQASWLRLNPMTVIAQAHRSLALYGQMPDWGALIRTGLVGLGLLGLSVAIFRALEDMFVEVV